MRITLVASFLLALTYVGENFKVWMEKGIGYCFLYAGLIFLVYGVIYGIVIRYELKQEIKKENKQDRYHSLR